MPYIPQLSGGQMPHCKFNFKVKVLQLSTSPVHSGPTNLEHNRLILKFPYFLESKNKLGIQG